MPTRGARWYTCEVKVESRTPFDEDVAHLGQYRYTDESCLSARFANERYTEMILKAAPFVGRSVVDVGAGDGTYTAELARRSGARCVLGIDPAGLAIERARRAYAHLAPQLEFIRGFSDDLVRAGRRFDLAVYRGVLHHVEDPRTELRRAMALADTVIVLEPNGLNAAMKLVERVSPYHRRHCERSFTPGAVTGWLREAGGWPERVRFFGLVPYFCPDAAARLGRLLEPAVESLFGVRALICGQYLILARGAS